MTKLNFFVIALSFLTFLYSIFHIGESSFSYIYILPLSVFFLSIILNNIYQYYSNSIVFYIYIFQLLIRYCILPALLSVGEAFSVGFYSHNLNLSVTIMGIELLVTFIILFIFSYKQYISYENRLLEVQLINNYTITIIFLICMFFYMYITNTFEKINPIWSVQQYVDEYITNQNELTIEGYGLILYQPFKAILSLLAISFIYNTKKIKDNNKKWAYLIVIILSLLFIVGVSRFNMTLSSMPILILITYLLNKKDNKLILTLSLASLALVTILTSIIKFSRYGNTSSLNSVITANSLNAYFSGPGNIANGLDAFDSLESNNFILFFINDTLQNIPILSKITTDEYMLTSVFNKYYYGHQLWADQIVPLSISGLFHFNIFGIFVYSSLLLTIALFFERLSYEISNIGYKYICITLSVSLSLIFMTHLGSNYAFIARTFLFLFIPIYFIINFSKFNYK